MIKEYIQKFLTTVKELRIQDKYLYSITLLVVIIGDQVTKYIVDSLMLLGQSQTIIPDFFYYTYAHNEGAAWGILKGRLSFFIIIAILATIGLIIYFASTKKQDKLTRYGIILVFGGLVGNLIDRLALGYVRDFIDFIVLGYDFPVFNIADIAVVIGVLLICLEIFFEDKLNGKVKQ